LTTAPGTTPPLLSVTVPKSGPEALTWAFKSKLASNAHASTAKTSLFMFDPFYPS
jgi:hypothetical protein